MVSIDLGSNTLRVLKFDCKNFERRKDFEKVVRSADGMHLSGKISDAALERIIDAIKEAKERIDFEDEIVATATAAFRKATNGKEVLKKIQAASGIQFKIIDGEDEAYYTCLGVSNGLLKLGIDETFACVDIGGGSTEIAFFDKETFVSKSFEVGIISVSQKHNTVDGIRMALPKLFSEVKEFLEDAKNIVRLKSCVYCATAGTPTTLAALKVGLDYGSYDHEKINGTKLYKEDLSKYLGILLKTSMQKREELVGVGRADLIISGILIFEYIFDLLKTEEFIAIDDGLREGIAIAKCKGMKI